MRNVCIITGSRAEYGLLSPVMHAIQKADNIELSVIATGMHLMARFGLTINEIKKDGFRIDEEVLVSEDEDISISFGQMVIGISKALKKIKPNFILVLGDRFEALAATIAARANNIIVAHIHGGDKTTSGHIDESIRWAISKFAHLHFVATTQSKNRLIQSGEEDFRIYQVGSPALDVILNKKLKPTSQIAKYFNLNLNEPIVVVLQHPVSLEAKQAGIQIEKTLLAIKELDTQTIIIYPNSDAGAIEMIEKIEKYRDLPHIQIYKNITHAFYLGLLKIASVLVGNSSSGIIEAPSFKLPVVNIGSRNVGREHAENVIFVDYDERQIVAGIKKALFDEKFKEKVKSVTSPYGNGKASSRIVEVLSNISFDKKLFTKQITY